MKLKEHSHIDLYALQLLYFYLQAHGQTVQIISAFKNEYNPAKRIIYLHHTDAMGYSLQNICTVLHEATHAIQHKRWPLLFWLHKIPLLRYFITIFLEVHASVCSIAYMQLNLELTPNELLQAKNFLTNSLRTYMGFHFWIRIICVTTIIWLLLSCAIPAPVQHNARYRSEKMEWPIYYPDSLQHSKIN